MEDERRAYDREQIAKELLIAEASPPFGYWVIISMDGDIPNMMAIPRGRVAERLM